jgi:flagellar protein FlaJ
MLKSKASFSLVGATGRDPALAQLKSRWLLDLDQSQFDLLTVLTYLSSVATANLSREQIFESAAKLGYGPSPYFARVANLVQSLGYDYAHACHVVSKSAKDEVMRQFLLRFGNSMASGEPEPVFLARETRVMMEDYTNEYERAIETLRKWTDAFVALMVSSNLVVLVALISNMIYSLGTVFMVLVEAVALLAAGLGAYLIYRIAPYDPIVHKLPFKSDEQKRMAWLARVCLPTAVLAVLLSYLALGSIGVSLILAAVIIAPVGYATLLLERKVDHRDRDIADFLRALGGVTAARGSTVIESLNHIDRRAIGSLEPELKRLMTRVSAGVITTLSWARFMADTGSELVHRVVRAFWDGNDWGGEPDKIGNFCADMALRVWLLRAKRKLVSSTFNYVVFPMHAALIGTLVFITEVVAAFNQKLVEAQAIAGSESPASINPEDIGIPNALAFQSFNTGFIEAMVLVVILALTAINAFAPRAASGGHGYKMCLYGAITMATTGLVLLIVPPVAQSMFSDTLSQPLE